jgi:transposase
VREEVSMAPYSMDLRTRVFRDWDAGMRAEDVAAKYSVSRAWVQRLQQRRRETGSIAPRKQTRWRTPILAAQLPRLEALIQEQPDRTLAELQAALGTAASLTTLWRAIARLEITVTKKPCARPRKSRCCRHGPARVAAAHGRDRPVSLGVSR